MKSEIGLVNWSFPFQIGWPNHRDCER